jgi:DNA-binding transcriptional LysR family regulator
MQTLRQLLPSADKLFVFEAGGRLLSFTSAGRELGMSQAAVSYAIRGLEEQLGVQLFRREHRKVALSETGARFYSDVLLGLSHIRKSVEEIRAFASQSHVTLAASTAFAAFWMMPRLQKFRDELPGIELRIQTSERDIDIAAERISLGIRAGLPQDWPGYNARMLAREEIIAVASPSYLEKHGRPKAVLDLLQHRLIHLEEPYRVAAKWNDWLLSAGVAPCEKKSGLLINDYALVIQAAMEGQGVALGWRHLTERLINAGLLVRVSDHCLVTGRGYYVLWPKTDKPLPHVKQVRQWLHANATPGVTILKNAQGE